MAGGGFRDGPFHPHSGSSSGSIQRNGLPLKKTAAFSRSTTNLASSSSAGGLTAFDIEIGSIKSSLRSSEAPVTRYSDPYFRRGGGAAAVPLPTNGVITRNDNGMNGNGVSPAVPFQNSYLNNSNYHAEQFSALSNHNGYQGLQLQGHRSAPLNQREKLSGTAITPAAPPPYAALTPDAYRLTGRNNNLYANGDLGQLLPARSQAQDRISSPFTASSTCSSNTNSYSRPTNDSPPHRLTTTHTVSSHSTHANNFINLSPAQSLQRLYSPQQPQQYQSQSSSSSALRHVLQHALETGEPFPDPWKVSLAPPSAVAAVQATLPAIAAQNVRSKFISMPLPMQASAPEPLRPRKSHPLYRGTEAPPPPPFSRNLLPYDSTAGPQLGMGRSERMTLGDAQFRETQQQEVFQLVAPPTYTGRYETPPQLSNAASGFNGRCEPVFLPEPPPHQQQQNQPQKQRHSQSPATSKSVPSLEDTRFAPSPPVTTVTSRLDGSETVVDENYVPTDRHRSASTCRRYMEQRMETIQRDCYDRQKRRMDLETEMTNMDLSEDFRQQFRQRLFDQESKNLRQSRAQGSSKMGTKDFEKLCTIGVGAFGQVILARKKETMKHYAVKILPKSDAMDPKKFAHVRAERDILAEASHSNIPWLVKLFYSFQDDLNLYFVMEYVPGGDLMTVLQIKGLFEEPLARFYTAELVCAIASVHAMKFIHRDIKPDNILIDGNGHIKLTDFGLCSGLRRTHKMQPQKSEDTATDDADIHIRSDSLAFINRPKEQLEKKGSGRKQKYGPTSSQRRNFSLQRQVAHSQVGTPNYMAPEVIASDGEAGYTQVCDWWSLGIILFEMLCGRVPFYAATPEEIQRKVLDWRSHLSVSSYPLSNEARDLITRLCCEPEKRLGSGKSDLMPTGRRGQVLVGADEIKNHPFFQPVNWSLTEKQKQPAPYVPRIQHMEDTSNFDSFDEDQSLWPGEGDRSWPPSDVPNGSAPFRGQKNPKFYDFTFRRFFEESGV
ncbi:Serine/threonine-protein kinase LATS1 [Hypsibius exemplaris]|uniref:non-specific serine/threonine protein kinase n=1 Tax=Hypsibius exemplaris TaxID=2072580 RepID=A0A1W0WJP3_HYPEX|nr:Serine/threonine-protein kinase LATS1 [Hypsibius exemplaris]